MNRQKIVNAGVVVLAAPLYVPALVLAFIVKLLLRLGQWGVSAIRVGIQKGWSLL